VNQGLNHLNRAWFTLSAEAQSASSSNDQALDQRLARQDILADKPEAAADIRAAGT